MSNLVEITEDSHELKLDLRYATKNNVCEVKMYKEAKLFLHKTAEEHLSKAIEIAKSKDLYLKIFDGFRPLEVQEFMYEKFSGDFVSNPETGSIPHCRGVAIDLTLIDKYGEELEMGSDFDEFSELAFHDSKTISEMADKNRKILLEIMTKAGFDFYEKEWWHYQLFNARSYEIEEVKGLSSV